MLRRMAYVALFLSTAICLAQDRNAATPASSLEAPATLPIVFANTVSAIIPPGGVATEADCAEELLEAILERIRREAATNVQTLIRKSPSQPRWHS